jgi:Domain of unknown function (DUF4387)/Acyclic terpene utilisation family protein AtuA
MTHTIPVLSPRCLFVNTISLASSSQTRIVAEVRWHSAIPRVECTEERTERRGLINLIESNISVVADSLQPSNMAPLKNPDEVRILTPIGMIGYGFSEKLVLKALESGVDAIIADSGSTDSGPSKLALGTTTVTVEAYERDLTMLLKATSFYKVPILIGSAGGDGSNAHVDMFLDIIIEAIKKQKLRQMKVITIYAEVDKKLIHENHAVKALEPCTRAVPPLLTKDINEATRVVAQMGYEPFLKAMEEHPDFDVIIGGRAYDPSPYTAFCVYNGFDNLAIDYHMGKIMECGAICAVPKSKEALAVVRKDSFDIVPLDPNARCTPLSVAAHTLYEKSRPDLLIGPGGTLDLNNATYEQLPDNRTVRVRGPTFHKTLDGEYTVKLEGARPCGYHSVFIGGIRDPVLISQIDNFVAQVKAFVSSKAGFEYGLKIHTYGINGVMGPLEPDISLIPKEVTLCGESRAATQAQATHIINLARIACMHGSYPHQLATAGNFAMPFSPFDIPMGQLSEFCIYHLMTISDPLSLFPISHHICEGFDETLPNDTPKLRTNEQKTNEKTKEHPLATAAPAKLANVNTTGHQVRGGIPALRPAPAEGTCYLGDVASVIRSKNAGPYELTFDVMFEDEEVFQKVKATGVLSRETIVRLYQIKDGDLLACMFWDQGRAFKATIKRPAVSGQFGESDVHGAAQHVPLIYLLLPIPREKLEVR